MICTTSILSNNLFIFSNYENFTIEEEPNVKQVKECKIEKIKNFSPNLNKYKTKFLSKTIEKTITNKDQSLSTSKVI